MTDEHSESEIWNLVGALKVSSNKAVILKALKSKFSTPKKLCDNTELNINQVSNTLQDLKERKLVECVNESARKGRIYRITPFGLEVLERLDSLD